MFKIKKTKFDGLLIIVGKKYDDKRGFLREVLIEKLIKKKFIFHITSKSKKNVLRGLHLQYKKPQGKYISVIKGKVFDAAVDLRVKSKTFGQTFTITLSEQNCTSVYIPEGFAHGFVTLGKENIILYSCTDYRSEESECSLNWKDKDLNISWPVKNALMSKKDKNAKSLSQLKKKLFT
tara:strand:+ start:235 stop:768 length:534 start_codon:yes stop_codon:yes gene_type:complete